MCRCSFTVKNPLFSVIYFPKYGVLFKKLNTKIHVEQQELSLIARGNAIMVQPLGETVWQLLTKLNTLFPYNPATMLLGIHPKELKT